MPRRNDISKILIIGSLMIGFSLWGQSKVKSQPVEPGHSVVCASHVDRAADRIFANPNGKLWKEYASAKKVPPLDGNNGEELILVKTSSSGMHYVHTERYGEDSAHYQQSCYDQAGTLRSLHYEMRTAWGWGYDEVQTFDGTGKLTGRSSHFFSTASNEKINRPAQAGEVPDFLRPEIYKRFRSLPIAGVFEHKS